MLPKPCVSEIHALCMLRIYALFFKSKERNLPVLSSLLHLHAYYLKTWICDQDWKLFFNQHFKIRFWKGHFFRWKLRNICSALMLHKTQLMTSTTLPLGLFLNLPSISILYKSLLAFKLAPDQARSSPTFEFNTTFL